MEKIMAVLTGERQYAERFCEYVNRKNNLILTAVPFSDPYECAAFSEKHRIEVLLADGEIISGGMDVKNGINAGRIIGLTEGSPFGAALAEENARYRYVSKYQSADGLMREVMDSCRDMEMVRVSEHLGRPVRIIGVYSPAGGWGKSAFSMTLCSMLSRSRKTLYLTLEEFSGLEGLTGENYSSCLSDAIYHMKQGSLNAQRICSMTYSYCGIEYIPPIRYAEDRNAVSGEDYVRLINTILKNSLYEVIVVEMGRFADEAADIMEICGKVYIPASERYAENIKVNDFLNYLNSAERNDLADKMIRVTLPPADYSGSLPYMEALIYGEMGDLVRELREV